MIMKKNGFVSTGLVSFLVYIGVVLIIILFYFIFKLGVGDTTVKISGYSADMNAGYALLNYLRSPIEVTIDGTKHDVAMADLIALSKVKHKEESARGELGLAKSHEILDSIYGNSKWAVNVCYSDTRPIDQKCWLYFNMQRWQSTVKGKNGNLLGESSVFIPGFDNENIEVTLRLLK